MDRQIIQLEEQVGIGLTFNTIQRPALRIEQTLLYRFGIVVRPTTPWPGGAMLEEAPALAVQA